MLKSENDFESEAEEERVGILKKTIHVDLVSHSILKTLAKRNFRTKRQQLRAILLEEAKRCGLNVDSISRRNRSGGGKSC